MNSLEEIIKVCRCQQCLSELSLIDGELICKKCSKIFPISNGLIFMGYDKNDRNKIQKIIDVERDHQTDLSDLQKHYDFAPGSYKIGLLSIDLLKDMVNLNNPIAVDIGSGGAPFAKILSEKGFNTFRLELDPNSLYAGLFWSHSNLDVGKHIVADASILPFEDNSIDIIFCKQFIHHIENYKSIFKEINRVLRKNGIFLLIEPTKRYKFLRTKGEKDTINSDVHHIKTIHEYYLALNNRGFKIHRYYLFYSRKSKKLKFLNSVKRYLNNQIYSKSKMSLFSLFSKMILQRIISGENIIYARKNYSLKLKEKRPDIEVVNPNVLILDNQYISDSRLIKFKEILDNVYTDFVTKSYEF